jgi:hypothetical protein
MMDDNVRLSRCLLTPRAVGRCIRAVVLAYGDPARIRLARSVVAQRTIGRSRSHRIACGGPRLNAALQRLDVAEPLRLVFRCLTGSTPLGGSSAVEDDFLCLRHRPHAGLKARQRDGPL